MSCSYFTHCCSRYEIQDCYTLPNCVSERWLSVIEDTITNITSGHKNPTIMIRNTMLVQMDKGIPLGYSG